jgi:AcrR family transcriptional regulator
VAAGRALFAERGFAGTSIEDVLRAADVSRGALYHHFRSKEDLFLAVYEAVEADLTAAVVRASLRGPTPLAQLQVGMAAFLDRCVDPEVQRIALLDGPTVLGWETWHELEERYAFGLIRAGLQAAVDAGEVAPQPVEPLAHAVLGAMIQSGSVVARAASPARAKREMKAMFARLLQGLAPST